MKYVIDSNIFLRILAKDDKKKFKECVAFIEAIKNGEIEACTTSINIAEVAWTLKSFYSYSREELLEALKGINGIQGLTIINSYNHNRGLKLFEKNNVKFIDCLLASIEEIQNGKWIIVSYDKDFDKLGVLRKEPGEVL